MVQIILNTAMATTAVVDYILYGGCMAYFLSFVLEDGKITVLQSVWFLTTLLNLIHARDYLYLYTLPHHLTAKAKRDYQASLTDLYFVAKQYVLFLTLTACLTYAGYFHMEFDYTNPAKSIAHVLLQFYAIALLKDNTGMRFLHPLMHGSWWTIHECHHKVRKELRILTTFHGDWSDLVLETAGGPVVYLFLCQLLGCNPEMNLLSWFCVVWMDINVHSINPFTVIFWNPLLDHMFKATICHHLHHIFLNDHMMFVPWRHWSKRARQADVQKFNKVLETRVDSDWFQMSSASTTKTMSQ